MVHMALHPPSSAAPQADSQRGKGLLCLAAPAYPSSVAELFPSLALVAPMSLLPIPLVVVPPS